MSALLPPCWIARGDSSSPLLTDDLGRDILSRLIFGARVAAVVSVIAASLACLLGSVLGLAAGFRRVSAGRQTQRHVQHYGLTGRNPVDMDNPFETGAEGKQHA